MAVVGVDACKTGWIAVVLRGDARAEAHHLPTIDSLPSVVDDAAVIAIDIPIGLPSSGYRTADLDGKRFLQRKHASLFLVPPRVVLQAPTHVEANALSVEITGRGISRQSYGLRAKIFEVEAWLRTAPCDVYEVHPEISFAVLLGTPCTASKKTWAGMIERQDALTRAGIELRHIAGPAARQAAVDDMLDAAAAAWTAQRILDGEARTFPATDTGRTIAIWA